MNLRSVAYLSVILLVLILITEALLNARAFFVPQYPRAYYYESHAAKLNLQSGYRFKPDQSLRIMRYAAGQVIFDNVFETNNWGFVSDIDFTTEKTKQRYLIFGDSFTCAEFLETNWPSRVNASLKQDSLEFYNFGLSGVGLKNWQLIYDSLIVQKEVEFDGIVFAVYGNDLERLYSILHIEESDGYILTTYKWPVSRQYLFENGHRTLKAANKKSMDRLRKKAETKTSLKPGRLGLKLVAAAKRVKNKFVRWKKYKERIEMDDSSHYQEPVGFSGFKKFIERVRAKDKEVIVALIPTREILLRGVTTTVLSHHLKTLCETEGLKFINGYDIFSGMNEATVEKYFFKHDGHWNQRGSDIFAQYFINQALVE